MKKYLKYALISVFSAVLLFVLLLATIALTVDPNKFKPQIVELVKEKKQRTLTLTGDIKLALFPKLGLDLGKVSISEHNGSKEFAAIDAARLYVAWLPLLKQTLVVEKIQLDGMRASLTRYPDGSTNFDDLLKKEEESKTIKFDIAGVKISNAALAFDDQQGGRKLAISKLELTTGKLADATPTKIDLGFTLQGDKPKFDFQTQLKSGLLFELEKKHFVLNDINLLIKGKLGTDDEELTLAVPKLELTAQTVNASEVVLNVNGKQGQHAMQGKLTTSVNGNLQNQVFDLTPLKLEASATHPSFPKGGMKLSVTGSVHADLAKQDISATFTTHLDDSNIQAKLGLRNFAEPFYHFDIGVDQINVDRYLAHEPAKQAAGPEQPFDFSALNKLNASGALRIGKLQYANIKSSNVRLDAKAGNGKLEVNPLAANLYQGTLNGTISLHAAGTPQLSVKQRLTGISIGPLLKDALDKDMLEGKGNVSLDLVTQGATASAMKRGLNGSAALNLADGAVKGINVAAALRKAKSAIGGEQVQAANTQEKTDFSDLNASFKVHNGVAHNDDLSLKSPLLRLTGNGDIDIGSSSMNYLAKATVVGTLAGQGGAELATLKGITVPIRVSGPFTDLKYALDFNAMATEAVKQKVEQQKEEVKAKLQEQLQEGLKGLFGR
jgi:AsmA protein